MRLSLFAGLRPFSRTEAGRDVQAGVTLASMNIPQVLGYTRIAGTPVVTGRYTVLLPLVAFAVFGSSRQARARPSRTTPAPLTPTLRRYSGPQVASGSSKKCAAGASGNSSYHSRGVGLSWVPA
jgi:SulP family sulfate permease